MALRLPATTGILGPDGGALAIDDARHLVGAGGGFRGYGDRAWVARGDARKTPLPTPSLDDPEGWWNNTYGRTIGRGVPAFAPQGGITVGGSAQADDVPMRAVLWTCAQTYLQ
jgi:hypothetical protein